VKRPDRTTCGNGAICQTALAGHPWLRVIPVWVAGTARPTRAPGADTASARLWSEVRCYVAWCVTFLEVFTDDIGEDLDLPAPISSGLSTVELLVDVRRRMSATPLAALALLDFRASRPSTAWRDPAKGHRRLRGGE
jgi:hypothetical protein